MNCIDLEDPSGTGYDPVSYVWKVADNRIGVRGSKSCGRDEYPGQPEGIKDD